MDQNILSKNYRLVRSDNFELFLKEVGAPRSELDYMARERPTVQIRRYDNSYILKTSNEHSSKNLKFRPNRIFVQDGYNGKKVQSVISFGTGNVLKELQSGVKPVTVIRKFSAGSMRETMACRNVVCRRYYTVSGC